MAVNALASVDRMLAMLDSRAYVPTTIEMSTSGLGCKYPDDATYQYMNCPATVDRKTKIITINIQGKQFKGAYPQDTLANYLHSLWNVWKTTKTRKRKVRYLLWTREEEETIETSITLQFCYDTDSSYMMSNLHFFTVTYTRPADE